jgi:inner membrane protein
VDPLTQGTLGAALPQSLHKREHARAAGVLGFLAGMAPDLDVLIRSPSDPLLFLEYHRQFTHSLFFIPIGGALCALLLHRLLGKRLGLSLPLAMVFCTLGYATHALLDACTSYGTLLLWPFSQKRFAWSAISVVDPLFTLPLLVAALLTMWLRRPTFIRWGLGWATAYLVFGIFQRDAAVHMGQQLAAQRGHSIESIEAKPSFGNILLWKTIYQSGDRYYVDAVRATLSPRFFEGESVALLNVARDLPWLLPDTQQAKDVERFRHFSNGYLALDPNHKNRIIDARYSMLPNEIKPLWSIQLDPGGGPRDHAGYVVNRDASAGRARILWEMIVGR